MHVAFVRFLKQFMSGAVRRAPCAALAVLTWITKLVNSRLAETAFNSCWVSHFEVVWIYISSSGIDQKHLNIKPPDIDMHQYIANNSR